MYSDEASLLWLLQFSEPNGRLLGWRMRLSKFDIDVQYKKDLLTT